jgi:hypothetical protein
MRSENDPDFNHKSMNDLKIMQYSKAFGVFGPVLFDMHGTRSQTLIFHEMEFYKWQVFAVCSFPDAR